MGDSTSFGEDETQVGGATTSNRRRRKRLPYEVMQRMAPCPDGKLPPLSTFQQIRCHDLSQSGLSFDTKTPILDEFIVLALGRGKETVFIRARVANSFPVKLGAGSAFRVGCEFLNRLEPGSQPA
jgi:PilZ domain-containing protein